MKPNERPSKHRVLPEGCSAARQSKAGVEHMFSTHEALGSIPSPQKNPFKKNIQNILS
jgi:hypothetical protein